jgi:2-dehydro-3-deoxyglucarate aldolase
MLEAETKVIEFCRRAGKSCGTQLANFSRETVDFALEKGYTFIIASSDLFVLNAWAEKAGQVIESYK